MARSAYNFSSMSKDKLLLHKNYVKSLFGFLIFILCSCSNSVDLEQSLSSVITVKTSELPLSSTNRNITIGSGVIISNDGVAVTNYHVVKNNLREIFIETNDGITFNARLLGVDERLDLAVLKIDSNRELFPAVIGDTRLIKLGDEIYAAGNPFGLGVTLSKGIISATGRDYGNPYLELIQTDAAINPGNSGGALLNRFGHLIGINTKIFSQTGGFQGISFAIPVDKIIKISSEIIQDGSAKRAWIGNFRVKPKRVLLNNNPTNILEILTSDNGPLFKDSDINVGDMIIKVNNKTATWENFVFYLNSAFPGDELELEILTNGKINKVVIKTEAN